MSDWSAILPASSSKTTSSLLSRNAIAPADSLANWRRENEGHGKTRVVRDLMARRVAPGLAKQAADAAYRGVDRWLVLSRAACLGRA